MEEYKREYPLFALCGLNCGLCPRFHTEGVSKCPGCGGPDFRLKHPACAVITCSKKHGSPEYCFRCPSFPCGRFSRENSADSFITYRNVMTDFEKAGRDLRQYKAELDEKVGILEFLIADFNDSRRKNFYCNAVNLLSLADLREILRVIREQVSPKEIPMKEKIEEIVRLFETRAEEEGISLKLRK